MKNMWSKDVFTTDARWPNEGVTLFVFHRADELFVPVTSLGQALGVNPESIPANFFGPPPEDFCADKRVRNVVRLAQLRPCIMAQLERQRKPADAETIERMVQSIYEVVERHVPVHDNTAGTRPKRLRESERDGDVKKISLDVQSIEKIARATETLIKDHVAFENRQAAILLLYNSPEFQAQRAQLTQEKLHQLSADLKQRADEMLEEARTRWQRHVLPRLHAQWEREAREAFEKTTLPKLQEEHIRQQATLVARQTFSATLRQPVEMPLVEEQRMRQHIEEMLAVNLESE